MKAFKSVGTSVQSKLKIRPECIGVFSIRTLNPLYLVHRKIMSIFVISSGYFIKALGVKKLLLGQPFYAMHAIQLFFFLRVEFLKKNH